MGGDTQPYQKSTFLGHPVSLTLSAESCPQRENSGVNCLHCSFFHYCKPNPTVQLVSNIKKNAK